MKPTTIRWMAFAAATFVSASLAFAGAVVKTAITSGNHQLAASTLKVRVYVSSNDLPTSTSNNIRANSFKVNYDSAHVTLDSVKTQLDLPAELGDLGNGFIGPVTGSSPNNYRIVATDGTGTPSTPLTPDIYTLVFTVVNPYPGPYSITVEDDPGTSWPLLPETLDRNVPHTFDNSDTVGLGLIPAPSVTDWSLIN